MEIWELKKELIDNNVPKLMIFTGIETKVRDIYINKVKEILGSNYKEFYSLKELINSRLQKGLYNSAPDFAILRDDTILGDDTSWVMLDSIDITTIVIFNDIDKKTKFFKKYEAQITTFERMDFDAIKMSIKSMLAKDNITLKDTYIDWLIEVCNFDYGRILTELDKILIFKMQAIDFNELFIRFAKEGVFHSDEQTNIFEFVNDIVSHNITKVLNNLEAIKTYSSPIAVLSLLYNNFRNILLVQSSKGLTPEQLGMSPKQHSAVKYRVGKYTNQQLVDILLMLGDIDTNIKQGKINQDIVIDYILSTLF